MFRSLAVLALALVSSCGSGTSEPHTPLTIEFHAAPVLAGYPAVINGVTYFQCTVTVTVTAKGGYPSDEAFWAGGHIDYRLTSTGQLASTAINASDQLEWFGTGRVVPGSSLSATRTLSWTGPFTAVIILNYGMSFHDNSSEDRSASLPITCQ